MSVEGFTPDIWREFRGEFTIQNNPQLVEKPYAINAQNVSFSKGGVRTRPGFNSQANFTVSIYNTKTKFDKNMLASINVGNLIFTA